MHVCTDSGPPATRATSNGRRGPAQVTSWALRRTVRARRVVCGPADVVLGIQLRVLSVLGVGVHHVDVHGEARVRKVHVLAPVGSGQPPAVAVPGVGDLLVPAVVEDAASPVVVAQDAQPWLAIQPRAVVHPLEDLIELVVRHKSDLVHGRAAGLLDAAPVEVVADVQDEHWVHFGGACLEGTGHQLLRLVVKALHKAAPGVASGPHGRVALNELLVIAEQLGVWLVEARAGEDAWPGFGPRRVCNEVRPALDGMQRAIQTAPVTSFVRHCLTSSQVKSYAAPNYGPEAMQCLYLKLVQT